MMILLRLVGSSVRRSVVEIVGPEELCQHLFELIPAPLGSFAGVLAHELEELGPQLSKDLLTLVEHLKALLICRPAGSCGCPVRIDEDFLLLGRSLQLSQSLVTSSLVGRIGIGLPYMAELFNDLALNRMPYLILSLQFTEYGSRNLRLTHTFLVIPRIELARNTCCDEYRTQITTPIQSVPAYGDRCSYDTGRYRPSSSCVTRRP